MNRNKGAENKMIRQTIKELLSIVALVIGFVVLIPALANAGWFDSKEQKYFNSFVECYKEVLDTKNPNCTLKIFDIKNKGHDWNKDKIDVSGYTEQELEKMALVLAFAHNCVSNKSKWNQEMWENPFAQGMCKKGGYPYNKKFDDPEYAKNALFGSNK